MAHTDPIDPATGRPSLAEHRGWHIYFEYPPIPLRQFDYQASDPNGDGEPVAYGSTIEECKAEIDRILEEREDERTGVPVIPVAHLKLVEPRKPDLLEQLRYHDDYDQLGKQPELLSNGFRRSDALLLIAGALCAAFVGALIGIVENGWFS